MDCKTTNPPDTVTAELTGALCDNKQMTLKTSKHPPTPSNTTNRNTILVRWEMSSCICCASATLFSRTHLNRILFTRIQNCAMPVHVLSCWPI